MNERGQSVSRSGSPPRSITAFFVMTAMAAMTAMLVHGIALGQIDLSGEWAQINYQDELPRGVGPLLGDFTGIPLNEAEAKATVQAEQSDRQPRDPTAG